jgi:hypothetical protein
VTHPNDLTPEPLKLSQEQRDRLTCGRCGASYIYATEGRDAVRRCGICGAPWRSKANVLKDGKR